MKNVLPNVKLASEVSQLPDDVLIGAAELAALTGYALLNVRQCRRRPVAGLPQPLPGLARLRWHLGTVRTWMRTGTLLSVNTGDDESMPLPRRGRPSKIEVATRRASGERAA